MHIDQSYDLLMEQRRMLDAVRVEQHAIFDKSIIALSTSAIGASLFLVAEISKAGEISNSLYLMICWIFYLTSVVSILFSLLAAARDAAREIEAIDEEIKSEGSPVQVQNPYRMVTKMLNGISASSFGIATVALLAFSYSNSF